MSDLEARRAGAVNAVGAADAQGDPGRGRRPRLRLPGASTREFLVIGVAAGILLLLGLVMTFSASIVVSARSSGDAFGMFTRQLTWAATGVALAGVVAISDYRWLRRLALAIMLGALLLAAAVLVPGVGVEIGDGVSRWLVVGAVTVQPSEVLKLALAIYSAHALAARWARIRAGDLRALLVPVVPFTAAAALLTLLGPDLETALLVAAIGGFTLFAAGLPWRLLLLGTTGAGAVAAFSVLSTEFRRNRFEAWLDPMAYRADLGWQSVQGLFAMGSGGVFGRGLGQGRGQWDFVPAVHTDFIFALIGEELGLLGALLVLLLLTALAVGGIRTARRAPDAFGRLLATGITGWLLLQATINIGSVVGLLPVTGVTLPLVSFGGSSLLVTLVGVGVLLSIARSSRLGRRDSTPPGAPTPGRRR